jgi:PAS domain S-box-containing protein
MLEGFAYCRMIYDQGCAQDFIYLDVNRSFESLTGLKNVVGKRVSEVIPGIRESDGELFETYGRVALTGKPERFELYVKALQMWFSISVYSPEKEHFVAVFDVITERKRIEKERQESEHQFRTLANSIPNLAWWANADGYITWYNGRWYEYTGTAPEQMEGWGWQSVHDPEMLPKVLEQWTASIATGQPFDMEFPLRGVDGVFRTFLTRVLPLKDSAGQVLRWFGTNTDISELKKVQDALQDSEKRYRRLFEAAKDGILILDADTGRIDDVNPFLLTLLGYSYDALCGKHLWEVGVFKDIAASKEAFKALQDNEYIRYDDLPLETINGKRIAVEFVSNVYLVDHHKVIQCNIRDISEQKQIKEERKLILNDVQKEKDRLQALINGISDEIWFADAQKKFTLANPSALHEFGLNSDANVIDIQKFAESLEVYRPDGSVRPVEEAPPFRALAGEVVKNQEEMVRTPETGEIRYRQVSSNPVRDAGGQIIGAVSVVRDITERKQAEDALRQSEDRFREAQRLAHIGSWYWDAKNDVTIGSDELLRIYGFDPATQTMPDFKEQRGRCYPEEDWERVNTAVQRTLETGVGYELDVRAIRNGEMIWVTTRGEVVRDAQNRIVGLRGTVQDIIQRKRA